MSEGLCGVSPATVLRVLFDVTVLVGVIVGRGSISVICRTRDPSKRHYLNNVILPVRESRNCPVSGFSIRRRNR